MTWTAKFDRRKSLGEFFVHVRHLQILRNHSSFPRVSLTNFFLLYEGHKRKPNTKHVETVSDDNCSRKTFKVVRKKEEHFYFPIRVTPARFTINLLMMAVELFGSRVSTCLISILLIVYGSFRSLNMEQEAREKEKKRQSESSNNLLTGEPVSHDSSKNCFWSRFISFSKDFLGIDSGFATLDTTHALCLPLGASISLLVMFFFFDSMQMLFAVCTASEFFRHLLFTQQRLIFRLSISQSSQPSHSLFSCFRCVNTSSVHAPTATGCHWAAVVASLPLSCWVSPCP